MRWNHSPWKGTSCWRSITLEPLQRIHKLLKDVFLQSMQQNVSIHRQGDAELLEGQLLVTVRIVHGNVSQYKYAVIHFRCTIPIAQPWWFCLIIMIIVQWNAMNQFRSYLLLYYANRCALHYYQTNNSTLISQLECYFVAVVWNNMEHWYFRGISAGAYQ